MNQKRTKHDVNRGNSRRISDLDKPNFEDMYLDLQSKYERLHQDHEKSREVLALRQEIYIEREQRMKEREKELQDMINELSMQRGDNSDRLRQLYHVNDLIQNRLSNMQGETEKQIEETTNRYEERIDEIIKIFKRELEKERKKVHI